MDVVETLSINLGPATTRNLVGRFDGEICGGVLVENASDDFPQQKKLENPLPNFAGSSPPISPKTSATSLWKSLVLRNGLGSSSELRESWIRTSVQIASTIAMRNYTEQIGALSQFTLSYIAHDVRFAIRITNRNRNEVAQYVAHQAC